jgi:hypothetical protein
MNKKVNIIFTSQEIYVGSLLSFLKGEQGDQKDLTEDDSFSRKYLAEIIGRYYAKWD